jgi:uncharacterized RDD family membrane protein YckC
MSPRAAKSPERELVTPEGVDLRLRLAEASERATAFLIDVAIIVGVLVAFTILCLIGLGAVGLKSAEAVGVIWLLGFFLVRNLYFILFELSPRAATPGKRRVGLRVAARSGGRLTADAVFARNAMRELEVYVPMTFVFSRGAGLDAWVVFFGVVWSAIFVFFPLMNRDRLRVGDLVAGTWVVKAPRTGLLRDMAEGRAGLAAPAAAFDFTPAQIDAYGVKELHVLEEVLRRYDPATVTAVAARIRAKIDWRPRPFEGDGDFLEAYYRALRGRLESRLLFGRRRLDKHDVG